MPCQLKIKAHNHILLLISITLERQSKAWRYTEQLSFLNIQENGNDWSLTGNDNVDVVV